MDIAILFRAIWKWISYTLRYKTDLEERHHGNYEGAVGGWGGGFSVGRPVRAKGHNWGGKCIQSLSVTYCWYKRESTHGGNREGAVWNYGWWIWTTPACSAAHTRHLLWSHLLQHCSTRGQRCWCWEGWERTLEGYSINQDLTLRASAPAPWTNLAPDRVLSVTEHRRNPSSHLALTLAPSSQAPPPTKVIAASTNWAKTGLCSLWILLSHQSHWAHRLQRDTGTQR